MLERAIAGLWVCLLYNLATTEILLLQGEASSLEGRQRTTRVLLKKKQESLDKT